ncbi:MAG: hypothetical protein JWM80_6021 [Cyanobacteria bacterium RYN_339]|nr:hypothetical protein [Cyanobacteria bacterium RYN_339]
MDYTPRAETIRQLAAAAYLPLVAIVLLSQRRYRDIRLIRFHCYQAIGVAIILLMTLLLASIGSTLFGSLPGVGLLINLIVGVMIMGAMLGATIVSFYGAVLGYQGNYTGVPILTDWVWQQVNGGQPAEPPKRRRRRVRPEDEIDWDELPVPATPQEEERP